MNETQRNLAVGITVLGALVTLGVLIVLFAGLPQWFQTGNTVVIHFQQTHDIIEGDAIVLLGKRVGTVTNVNFTEGDPRKGITIIAIIDSDIRLPTNIKAKVFTKGIVGKGYLTLIPEGPLKTGPDGKRVEFYPRDETLTLTGIHDAGGGMLPAELTNALTEFGQLAENLNDLIAPPPDSQPATAAATIGPAPEPPPGLKGTVARLNRTLDALHEVVGSVENQKNIHDALAHLADASEKATHAMDALKDLAADGQKTLGQADELTRKLIGDADQIARLLTELQKTVRTVNQGKGTMGKLLSDPKLYNNLLQLTQRMDLLVRDFRELTDTWKKQGVNIRLK
jgi:phospholipid/cholesterol/gamma-HCH transport system substrate-binding protein